MSAARRRLPALAVLLAAAPAAAQDIAAPERYAAARASIASEVERGRAPSVAIAVMEDGALVWAEGFGLADREAGRAATADTIYRLASISKPFTATAVMKLVENGVLDLDQPVNRYLEGSAVVAYRGRADAITLRRLANHTGGLPTHWNFFYRSPGSHAPPPRGETIARYGFAAFAPGTRTNYSNLAFGILDHVVATASGRTFRDFLRDEILDPLGMAHTDLGVRPGREGSAAVGYRRDGDGQFVPVVDYGFDHDGASAVRSSARDLMQFARLQVDGGEVDGGRVLTAATVEAMRVRRAPDAGSSFGVGWSVGATRGTLSLSHTGGMPGVSTALQVFPERRAAVTVLTNGDDRSVTNRSLDALLDALLGSDEPGPTRAAPSEDTPQPPPAGRWLGHVAHPDGPIPLELHLGTDPPARLRLGCAEITELPRLDLRETRVGLHFRAALPTNPGFDGTPALHLELDRDGDGWSGLLYADAAATCRLPHWVQLAPAAPKPAETLRVVTWNVLVGFADHGIGDPYLPGVQRRAAAAAWLAAQQPCVVALQELNGFTEERLRRLAAAWGHGHAAILEEDGYPVGLTSRAPIEVIERRRQGLHHGILHCRTAGVDFVVVHVVPFAGVERKLREVAQVLECYRAARTAGRPVLLLGDFNCVSADDHGRLSPEALARYAKWQWATTEGGAPAELALGPIAEAAVVDVLLAHRDASPLPLPRIDFVFASPDLAARCLDCRWLPEPRLLTWSDHPPVVADFAIGR